MLKYLSPLSPQEQYQFLYTAIEGAFPVQNGTVKTPTAKDAAQIVNETTALLTEPNRKDGAEQKAAEEESKAPDSKAEESKAEESKAPDSSEQQASESSTAAASPAEGDSEKPTTTEGTTNGPAATVEV